MHRSNNNNSDYNKTRTTEPQAELESQFILTLPVEPAKVLREALRSGAPLKDRLVIKLENDMRYGEVRFDNWVFHAKVMDLPTIVEALKTIDNKSFYKTSDICQKLICKEEDDLTTDDESPVKQKKKDPNKVDRKFLWPHGITPPTKNIRKRRFRKTLKKKYVEAPEIEKEVKQLLRVDNEAVNVKWEVICEDEDSSKPNKISDSGTVNTKIEPADVDPSSITNDIAEHDIFGEAVSDSENDDEETNINVIEIDDASRLSADSRVSDSNSIQVNYERTGQDTNSTSNVLLTEFSKEMFQQPSSSTEVPESQQTLPVTTDDPLIKIPKTEDFHSEYIIEDNYNETPPINDSKETLQIRLVTLHNELAELRQRRHQHEAEISNIENLKLRQRLQENIDKIIAQEIQKKQEIQQIQELE